MTHTLLIPGWRPHTLNQLMGVHHMVAHRRKKLDREYVALYARLQRVPEAAGPRRVSLVLTLARGERRPDEDAWWKSTLDSLAAAKLLVDDSPKWCRLGPVEYDRGPERATAITLEDLA